MSWLSFWQTTEADVIKIVIKAITVIKQDAVTAEKAVSIIKKDIDTALKWIADNTPTIAADVEQVLSIVQILGITNPGVTAAVSTANAAVQALNEYASAYESGQGTAEAVVKGYAAFKQAQASAALAASAAASAPVPKAA